MPEAMRYRDQIAVVTGAAQGIGRATATRLAAEGATVFIADLAGERAEAVAEELREGGLAAVSHEIDLRVERAIDAMIEEVLGRHGRLDVLVNNVGISPRATVQDTTLDTWREVMAVNLESAFLCSRAALPTMREHRYGRIVNISSGTFLLGLAELSAYVASKGGVIGFTRVLAREVGQDGITANVVMPGLIATEFTADMLGDQTDAFFARHLAEQCVGRRGAPADIAEAVAYVASPQAGFLTGQTINVGGGHTFL